MMIIIINKMIINLRIFKQFLLRDDERKGRNRENEKKTEVSASYSSIAKNVK